MRFRSIAPVALLLALAALASSATAQLTPPQKATLRLAADGAVEPGAALRLTARLSVDAGWHVNSHEPTYEWLIPTELELELPPGWETLAISYPEGEMQTFAFADEPISVYDGEVRIDADLRVAPAAAGTVAIAGTVRYQACDDRSCLPPTTAEARLTLSVVGGAPGSTTPADASGGALGDGGPEEGGAGGPGAVAATPESGGPGAASPGDPGNAEPASAAPGGGRLALILGLGLLGGLILNVMPCVLPVLSLKIFGLVKSAGEGRSAVVTGSLATSAGILASFWALALAAVVARRAGAAVGWGVQFQEPLFVVFLTVVVVLFSLNLWGLFEIQLPGFLRRLTGSGSGEGVPGHFVSGLFATLMATPCSAPFLGTALSFALSQKAGTVFATFTAVGLGMALPYLAVAASPRALSVLPKPGAWMNRLKGVMGFLLAGAAIWLLYVLSSQMAPDRLALVEVALLAMALCFWLRAGGGTRTRRLAALGALVAVVAAFWLAAGAGGSRPALAAAETSKLIQWIAFDRAEAQRLAAAGNLVFVDVTAEWCFTCKVNERLVLETPEIAGLFERHQVIAMKADWTNRSDAIAAFLADHGRYGIPFYLLYRPGAEPHLFGELLTKQTVIEVVEQAAADTTRLTQIPRSEP